ncbi:MAG: hypothetical protein IPI14_06655 [Polaromonas sp.]|nr:hypothetical protein [Polaromonas sp.]
MLAWHQRCCQLAWPCRRPSTATVRADKVAQTTLEREAIKLQKPAKRTY